MIRCSTLLALVLVALLAGSARAEPAFHECQHPVKTGVEVSRLHHIGVKRACVAALRLYRYEARGHEDELYRCDGMRPVLLRHRFAGYRLRLHGYRFTMVRGRGRFDVSGTDFPVNCF